MGSAGILSVAMVAFMDEEVPAPNRLGNRITQSRNREQPSDIMSRVSVLIPHHKNPKILKPLLDSLLNMVIDETVMRIVLVDNASADGSVEYVRRYFPQVEIFPLQKNEGYAPALNKAANAMDSEWLCFLNNDVRVDPDWLPNLLHAAEKINAPCFSSHLLNWEGTQTQFAGGWINWFGKGFETSQLADTDPYPIFFPCGGAMLIRRDIFLEIGGFDDDYFMIYEDVDIGWRLWLFGYEVYLIPDAYVMHKGHTSLKSESYEKKALYFERNSLATLYKNLAYDSLQLIFPLALREAVLRAKAIGGIGVPVRYSSAGFATLQGLNAFFEQLAKWKQKRNVIQNRRKRSDAEILSRFFTHSTQLWAYSHEHYRRLHIPEIQSELHRLLKKSEYCNTVK
ncbi:MAG: glycosyltransferase family 2 protein [Candidatus Omnitrophota bacterium]|jgi:GT2 family glycosyltransferase|nr:MAG: glycosyltransferase family 2 protein [Candidatus Omnitrophota bacterium]